MSFPIPSRSPRTTLLLVGIVAAAMALLFVKYRASAPQTAAAKESVSANLDESGDRIELPPGVQKRNPIQLVTVGKTKLARDVEVVGSVSYDGNQFARVGPLIAGRIASVRVGLGDKVQTGQVLAELDSAEVGQAAAAYLTAQAAAAAAQANLRRERELADRKVSSERERELAQAQSAADAASLSASVQRLRTLGLRPEDIRELHRAGEKPLHVPLISPISGTVLTRQVAIGQSVQPATDAFTVANLERLWVLLEIFEKDLPYVHVGQKVELRTEVYPGKTFPAQVAQIGQVIDEKTRTAPVRIQFDNTSGLFRPGQFVTATLHGDPAHSLHEVLTVPRSAVLTSEGRVLLFVADGRGGFVRRRIELGASGGGRVEVRSGLSGGEQVVADGAFLLKSEMLR